MNVLTMLAVTLPSGRFTDEAEIRRVGLRLAGLLKNFDPTLRFFEIAIELMDAHELLTERLAAPSPLPEQLVPIVNEINDRIHKSIIDHLQSPRDLRVSSNARRIS